MLAARWFPGLVGGIDEHALRYGPESPPRLDTIGYY